jgi:hypothetical protein
MTGGRAAMDLVDDTRMIGSVTLSWAYIAAAALLSVLGAAGVMGGH